ncbi:hypothetical protein HanIR_Chr05g0247901 [Helianthus annuus]|nr:hypothetical protein HanIR_Chr05g0247901 [Helianthus annuus]
MNKDMYDTTVKSKYLNKVLEVKSFQLHIVSSFKCYFYTDISNCIFKLVFVFFFSSSLHYV